MHGGGNVVHRQVRTSFTVHSMRSMADKASDATSRFVGSSMCCSMFRVAAEGCT